MAKSRLELLKEEAIKKFGQEGFEQKLQEGGFTAPATTTEPTPNVP